MASVCENNADANSRAVQPARDFRNRSKSLAHSAWQMRAAMVQNAVQQRTHTRRLPLPTTLDVYVCGCHYRALYRGHGLDKVAYLLEGVDPKDGHPLAGKVLKVCKEPDPEPNLFALHEDSGVYPRIWAEGFVSEFDSVAQPVRQWIGWITDLAVPLGQALREPGLSREAAEKVRGWCSAHHAPSGHT